MKVQQQDHEIVLERLNTLERQNWRFKRGALAAAFVLACTGLMAANSVWPKVLETEKLVIKDETGKIWSTIEASSTTGVVQVLMDDKGTERIRLSVDQEGIGRLKAIDDQGVLRVSLYTYPSGHNVAPNQAGVTLVGPGKDRPQEKKESIGLATREGWAFQRFTDQAGKSRVMTFVNPNGDVGEQFSDKESKERWSINVFGSGLVNQRLSDSNGKLRLVAYADAAGNAEQQSYDKDEKLVQAKPAEVPVPRVAYRPIPADTPRLAPSSQPRREEPKPREEQCLNCRAADRSPAPIVAEPVRSPARNATVTARSSARSATPTAWFRRGSSRPARSLAKIAGATSTPLAPIAAAPSGRNALVGFPGVGATGRSRARNASVRAD